MGESSSAHKKRVQCGQISQSRRRTGSIPPYLTAPFTSNDFFPASHDRQESRVLAPSRGRYFPEGQE